MRLKIVIYLLVVYTGSVDRKEYIRKWQREWMRKRRDDFFCGKKCIKCGSIEKLELDHINPENKKTHRIWSFKKDRFDEEVQKCQVLCHSCHLQKTKEWYVTNRKHGRTWYKYGCRCEICRGAQRKHNAQRGNPPAI